jgi:hypothetical protein
MQANILKQILARDNNLRSAARMTPDLPHRRNAIISVANLRDFTTRLALKMTIKGHQICCQLCITLLRGR